MTSEAIVQFETLQWAWTVGKNFETVEEYRKLLSETLLRLGAGEAIDFRKAIDESLEAIEI